MVVIIIFQTMTISGGNIAKDMINVYPFTRGILIATTSVAFIFALAYSIFRRKDHRCACSCLEQPPKMHLIVLFLFFASIADVLFNTLDDNTYGFIAFIAAYIVIGIILYRRKYELIVRSAILIFLIVGVWIIGRLSSVKFAIQLVACAMLTSNFIIAMINRFKFKINYGSYFMVAMLLQLISDAALFFRTVTLSMPVASNICSYVVWTLYIAANVLFVLSLSQPQNKNTRPVSTRTGAST
jgi:hypothetical protein